MDFARFTGLDHDTDRGTQALPDQVMVDGRAGEQRRYRDIVRSRAAIGEDDNVDAFADRRLGAHAQRLERIL